MVLNIQDKDLTSEVIQHLNTLAKSITALNGSHDRLHQAHDQLLACAKAHDIAHKGAVLAGRITADDDLDKAHRLHKAAHESARLQRVQHKAVHNQHRDALTAAVASLQKLLGGGAATAMSKPASAGPEPGLKVASDVLGVAKTQTNLPRHGFLHPFDVLAAKVAASDGLKKHERRVPPNSINPHWSGGVNQGKNLLVERE
jgi:hypothetical protein